MAAIDETPLGNHADTQAIIVALNDAIKAITAKLDADAGVTDTDYAATCDPDVTTS